MFIDGEAEGDSQDSSDEDADSDSDSLADFKDDSSEVGFATEEMKLKFNQELRQREIEDFQNQTRQLYESIFSGQLGRKRKRGDVEIDIGEY